jgi:aryl-alcohol dehydrogenase-like predicted oxidoreductase
LPDDFVDDPGNISLGMKTRLFGNTGRKVSEVGLGCWQLGGTEWGNVSDDQALAILGAAADSGVTFFDTADVYGGGRSERLIGRFLKEGSKEIFVATKLGRMPDLYPDKYTERGVRAAIEASLARLTVEAVDLIQLHCVPAEVMRQGEIFEWLRKLQEEGKVRNFGASVESVDEALLCIEQTGLASLQIIFNIFRQKPIAALFPQAKQKGVAIIVRLPLASGLLSGKLTKDTKFGEKDHRFFNRDGQQFNVGETFAGIPFEKGVELAEEMKAFVPEGLSMAQLAQRWILDYDAVSVIIPGATSPAQAKENARASDLPALSRPLHDRLENYYQSEVEPFIRGPY